MGRHSNGCITCKTRRLKCDENRPTCNRCCKSGVSCKGYSANSTWIDESARIQHTLAVSRLQQDELLALQNRQCSLHHINSHKARYRLDSCVLSSEISLVAFKQNILVSHLVSKLFEGRELSGSRASKDIWVYQLAQTSHESLDALAAMMFGQSHCLTDVVREARRSYGKALSVLQAHLLSFDQVQKNDFKVISSITAVCMYEITDRRADIAWHHHAEALAYLVQATGPSYYNKYPARSLYQDHRMILIMKALFSGARTFLGEDTWKSTRLGPAASSQQTFDKLVDILCDVANLRASVKTCAGQIKSSAMHELKASILASMDDLDAWWGEWTKNNPNCCCEVIPNLSSTITRDADGLIFPTLLEYNGLQEAYTVCVYDATRILLLQILKIIQRAVRITGKNPSIPTPRAPLTATQPKGQNMGPYPNEDSSRPLLGLSSDTRSLAHEILRTIEFCSVSSHQFLGSFACPFVLDVAYSCLEADSRAAKWLRSKTMLQSTAVSGDLRVGEVAISVLPNCQVRQGA